MSTPPFYHSSDLPTKVEKSSMWRVISQEVPVKSRSLSMIKIHFPSFMYGAVASILLVLSGFGVVTLYSQASQVPQNRIDVAYEDALTTMNTVSHELIDLAPVHKRPMLEAKQGTMEEIDSAIAEIRTDMLLKGNTEYKQRQLRRLYAIKLDYMKELLLKGEQEL